MFIDLRKYALWSCLLAALLIAACAPPAEEQPRPEPVTLKVLLLPYLSFAPFFIAEEEGYFAEQGLEIEFIRMARNLEAIPALAQGEIDVVAGSVTINTLNAIAHGARLRYVADKGYFDPTGCGTYSAIMARRSLMEAGELDDPTRMQGRRIAMYTAGASEYLVDTILGSAGLTMNDIEIADVPAPTMADAFGDGTIDLAVISEPWITRIQDTGNAAVWMPFAQVLPDFQWVLIQYGPSLLDENPDAGRRFLVAYLKAVRQYNEGKTERNIAIVSKATGLDETLLTEVCWPSFRDDGSVNMHSVLDYQAWAVERGYLDTPVTEEQLWDPSFVEQANEVLEGLSP